jgi:hypothetical protein
MMIYPVPEIFKAPDFSFYPSDNWPDFEYWFMQTITEDELRSIGRVYLPILFTAYFKRNGYGSSEGVATLQRFIDTIPTGMKYFTIVQYDDGTLVDWKDKDVKVFAMSGKPKGCIPIPLVCQPHSFSFPKIEKDILVSFVGRVTDSSREIILNWGRNMDRDDIYVSSLPHTMKEYCNILARSKFVFCPRGYGASSFRIAETYQYFGRPIIFKQAMDTIFSCPYSLQFDYIKFHDLDQILYRYLTPDQYESTDDIKIKAKELYSFEGVKNIILTGLWDLL